MGLTHLFILASMIAGLLAGLIFGKPGYYMLLGWCCVTIFVFTVRGRRCSARLLLRMDGWPSPQLLWVFGHLPTLTFPNGFPSSILPLPDPFAAPEDPV